MQKKIIKISASAQKNKETHNFRPSATNDMEAGKIINWSEMAEKYPEKFFKYLSDKLRLVEKKKKDADQFKTYLRQQALERMSNPSYSVIGDDPMDDDDVSSDAFSVANFD